MCPVFGLMCPLWRGRCPVVGGAPFTVPALRQAQGRVAEGLRRGSPRTVAPHGRLGIGSPRIGPGDLEWHEVQGCDCRPWRASPGYPPGAPLHGENGWGRRDDIGRMDGAGEDYGDGRGDAAEGSSQLNVIHYRWRPLRTPGVGARKTPHRIRPRTADPRIESPGSGPGQAGAGSASPPGEGDESPRLRVRAAFCKVSVGAADCRCYDQAMRA